MKTIKKAWNWIKSFFTSENIGIVIKTIFTSTKSAIAGLIADPEIQAQALALVKTLNSTDKTSDQKREEFNAAMKTWATQVGKEIGSSTMNTIRELAVTAAKAEIEQAEAI